MRTCRYCKNFKVGTYTVTDDMGDTEEYDGECRRDRCRGRICVVKYSHTCIDWDPIEEIKKKSL